MLSGKPSTCSASTFASKRRQSARAAEEAAMLRLSADSSGDKRISKTIAAMERDDTAREIVILTILQAGGLHHFDQFLLFGKLADRLGQITIARFVTCDDLAEPRQYGERVGVVQRLQPRN